MNKLIMAVMLGVAVTTSAVAWNCYQQLKALQEKEAMFNYGIRLQKFRASHGTRDMVFDNEWRSRHETGK